MEELEKRIAALEQQLEDGKEKSKLAINLLIIVIQRFMEQFSIYSPEAEKMMDDLKEKYL